MARRVKVYLKEVVEDSYLEWENDLDFTKITPPSTVKSILEVCGQVKHAAISYHYNYLAVINPKNDQEILHVVYLKDKRLKAVRRFKKIINTIYFVPDTENLLLIASSCGKLYSFDLESKNVKVLEGHKSAPCRISKRYRSDLLISWNSKEALLWSWPESVLKKRLNIDSDNIVECGHAWEKHTVFVALRNGVILLWDERQNMKESAIDLPEGISMEFTSFTISTDAEWIIGVGSQSLIVVYSILTQRVSQVVHFSQPGTCLRINRAEFLPCIHPHYPKTYFLETSESIILADLINSSVIKVLKSFRYPVCSIAVSGDGFLVGVTYGNGSLKLYTLPSFFPQSSPSLKNLDSNPEEIKFRKLKVDESVKSRKEVETLFDATKWKAIIKEHKEFPKKYRKHIWISLMKLPKNYSIFNEILNKEKKHLFNCFDKGLVGETDDILDAIKSTMECLYYWAPFLTKVDFLPSLIYGFVEVFRSNLLICFEASVFIILNWCHFWFERWPSYSKTSVDFVDDILCENEAKLWASLRRLNLSPQLYIWPLLISAFRKVLAKDDWLIVWDHVLSKPQSFLYCVCAAIIASLKKPLLKAATEQLALELFVQETWVPARIILQKANEFQQTLFLEEDMKNRLTVKRFLPLGSLIPFDMGPNSSLGNVNITLKSASSATECSDATTKAIQILNPSRSLQTLQFSRVRSERSPKRGELAKNVKNVEGKTCRNDAKTT